MNTPTPETDELVNRCGSFEINEQIWADELATLARKLERERDELKSWKESMLAVESVWEPQEIARLLDIKLGHDIRAQLKPAIVKLISERDQLRKVCDKLRAIAKGDFSTQAEVDDAFDAYNSLPHVKERAKV